MGLLCACGVFYVLISGQGYKASLQQSKTILCSGKKKKKSSNFSLGQERKKRL